jgi:hypothetical protein
MTPKEHLAFMIDFLKRWQADYDRAKTANDAKLMAYCADNIARLTAWIADVRAIIRHNEVSK